MYVLCCNDETKFKGTPDAVFADHAKGEKFYNAMPEEIRKNYLPIVIAQDFPLFWIWSWDRDDQKNKAKYNVKLTDYAGADAFMKAFKRDLDWEKKYAELDDLFFDEPEKYAALSKEYGIDTRTTDDQYFYLGIVWEEGISYGLRKDLKMPIDPYSLHWMFDHDHVTGDLLGMFKSMGVRRAMVNRRGGRKVYGRFRARAKRFKRLMEFSRAKPLSDTAQKRLKRLGNWLRRNKPKFDKAFNP